MTDKLPCHLLELPIELRQFIYVYAVPNQPTLTAGIAVLKGSGSEFIYRQDIEGESPFPGIPNGSEPIIEAGYDASLLSADSPKIIHLTPTTPDPLEPAHDEETYNALLLLNKQIHDELISHFTTASRRLTDLYLQYPHGIHVLHSAAPQLLRRSRTVHITGTYRRTPLHSRRIARLVARGLKVPAAQWQGNIIPDSAKELGRLVRTMFQEYDTAEPFEKLEMRIYFPSASSHSTAFSDFDSPIAAAMRNIGDHRIDLETYRGRQGTATFLTAWPKSEKRRAVRLTHRRLEEDARGQPTGSSCMINPKWPSRRVEVEPEVENGRR